MRVLLQGQLSEAMIFPLATFLAMDTFGNHARRDARRREREQHIARMEELVSSEVMLWDDDEPIATAIGESRLRQAEESHQHGRPLTAPLDKISLRSCIALLCLVSVIAIAAGFAFGLERDNGLKVPEISDDTRYTTLFNAILDWEVTPRSALENDGSSQWHALQWLAYEDTDTKSIEAVRTRYALATLFYSTHEVATESGTLRSWHDQTHWLSSYPVCLWHGVECHDEDNTLERVISLNLTSNGLGGSLPDELSMLELDIHFLDISDNGLEGTIPESLSKLRNLRKFCVSSLVPKVIQSSLTRPSCLLCHRGTLSRPELLQRDHTVQPLEVEPLDALVSQWLFSHWHCSLRNRFIDQPYGDGVVQ